MQSEIISDYREIDFKKWNNFVNCHPDGTVFQSAEMYNLFKNTKKFNPVPIALMENGNISGLLLGVIIREYSNFIGYFSSRTVVYGGPLIDPQASQTDHILDKLLKELIKKVKGKSVFIQFRNFTDVNDCKAIFLNNGFKYLERLNYLVDTSAEAIVRERISSSKLRQIKKGLHSGAVIAGPENVNEVRDFYEILYYLYKFKVKKPLPEWSFFENFYEQSKDGKLGIIRLVKYNGKVIGGILSPVFNNKSIYEWYVCGLDEEFRNVYPSVLATWAAIDYALKHNIKTFDFMGVGVPDRDYGVREFKARFGGELVNFGRFGKINNKFVYIITEIGYNILSIFKGI
ncbi:MAG: peptidoglycan bridge formation glycyltransferase FemA/FemB family protein [Bacteroidetes bacterium]|nr:peptidoglycan bridge formation glycyltransferase FemA/FemB family protein [Bacteroidota bacterium]